ncbi:MAG: HAD family hydrolase [Clostridia bacterium]|nr:HAD family hydrolase [Clostridia bacterium]
MENTKIKGISTIIWDCDNTIWIHREDELEALIAKGVGIPYTEELKEQYYGFFDAFNKRFENEKVTFKKTAKLIEERMPILSIYGVTGSYFLDKWIPLETSFVNEEAVEVLKYQREEGYKIVILTDWFMASQVKLLSKYGVSQYIERIYACDNQYMKISPKSVGRIIKSGNESEYVIIGDSLNSDIAFAQHAKISSIWYNPSKKENTTQYIPTAEVESLLEVIDIIE